MACGNSLQAGANQLLSIGAVGESACPFLPESETDDFQMRSVDEAIGCAGVDQEETFPGRVGFSRIA